MAQRPLNVALQELNDALIALNNQSAITDILTKHKQSTFKVQQSLCVINSATTTAKALQQLLANINMTFGSPNNDNITNEKSINCSDDMTFEEDTDSSSTASLIEPWRITPWGPKDNGQSTKRLPPPYSGQSTPPPISNWDPKRSTPPPTTKEERISYYWYKYHCTLNH